MKMNKKRNFSDVTRKEYQEDKELNAWALVCLQSLAKAKRKDRKKLIQKYRGKIVEKVIEAGIRLSKSPSESPKS